VSNPSISCPPIHRCFLAGGPERLRLSLPAGVAICGAGLLLWLTTEVLPTFTACTATAAAIATAAAVLVAALAARWLGSRLGALAGVLQLISTFLLLPVRWGVAEMLFCLAVTAAMGAFALGNVPGRLPLIDRRWTRCTFYAAAGAAFLLAGPAGPAFILAGCLLLMAYSSDSRCLRFLADPVAVVLLVLPIAVRLVYPQDSYLAWAPISALSAAAMGPRMSLPEVLGSFFAATWPWTPPALLALVVGLRQGHYATPIWQFFGCCLIASLAVMAAGPFRHAAYLAAILPPMVVISSAGIWGMYIECRRRDLWCGSFFSKRMQYSKDIG